MVIGLTKNGGENGWFVVNAKRRGGDPRNTPGVHPPRGIGMSPEIPCGVHHKKSKGGKQKVKTWTMWGQTKREGLGPLGGWGGGKDKIRASREKKKAGIPHGGREAGEEAPWSDVKFA